MDNQIDKDSFYYYSIGFAEFEKRNLNAAVINFSISIEIEPHFKTYHRLAEVFEKLGKEAEAFESLQTAYRLNQKNDFVAITYAEKLYEKGNLDRCITVLNDIIDQIQEKRIINPEMRAGQITLFYCFQSLLLPAVIIN